jgi:hypothetical protein
MSFFLVSELTIVGSRQSPRPGGSLVDIAEPPRIVFESSARCPDGRRAEEVLGRVLARTAAPRRGWVVTVRFDAKAPGVLQAEGDIADEAGAAVGHRSFKGRPGGDCSGLASAIGVWASLVLDAEIKRPRPVATEPDAPAPAPDGVAGLAASVPPRETPSLLSSGAGPASAVSVAAPPPAEKLSRREDGRTLEVGAGGFLMSGAGGGVLVGASPFLLFEVTKGVFLRPALAFGESLPATDTVSVVLAATRMDACLRFTGLYTNLHGMDLDLCAGGDLGALSQSGGEAVPYLAFGPSLDLQGELGGDLAVVLRGLGSINALHQDSIHTPQVSGRGELAFSWRLR